jgi:prepilin-type N-terminal cleavage/methylation domain-containing protein
MVKREEERGVAVRTPYRGQHSGFSLIEVMVSVILITTVIAALLQLFANNTHMLDGMEARTDHTLRASLLLGNPKYGFEQEQTTLSDLVDDFELADSFRHRLKATRLHLGYHADLQLDDTTLMGAETPAAEEEKEGEAAAETSGAFVLEIGQTTLKIGDQRSAWTRLRLQ